MKLTTKGNIMTTEQPYRIDPRLLCPSCVKANVTHVGTLRVPLVFNATDPYSGAYWCARCDRADMMARVHVHGRGIQIRRAAWLEYRTDMDEIEHVGRGDDGNWTRDNDPDWHHDC